MPVLALTPPKFIFTSAQRIAFAFLRQGGGSEGDESIESLRDKVTALQDENAWLKGQTLDAWGKLAALNQLQQNYQIRPQDVLSATVTGHQAGSGASILNLDKGSKNGVQAGAPVVAVFERICLLGRVSNVGLVTCDVRLASDPGGKGIVVQIVRPQLQTTPRGPVLQDIAVTSQPYLMIGKGGNQMEIDGINVSDAQPMKGDLVCLTDRDWWANTQHMVLGQVDAVGKQDNQQLRYRITVSPRVPIMTQRTVMIVMKE